MGSSISRFDMELDDESDGQNEMHPVAAGSVLQGKVLVETNRPLSLPQRSNTNSNSSSNSSSSTDSSSDPVVRLEFYGKEKVRLNRSQAKLTPGIPSSQSAPTTAERQLIHLTMQWPAFPEIVSSSSSKNKNMMIPPGTHVFPFQIQLPSSLPSSTYYPIHDNRSRSQLNFRIQYKLVASLHLNAASSSSAQSSPPQPMKATDTVPKYVWIQAVTSRPLPEPVPCMVQPIYQDITSTGGWIQKGQFWFGASLANCKVVLSSKSSSNKNDNNSDFKSRPTALHNPEQSLVTAVHAAPAQGNKSHHARGNMMDHAATTDNVLDVNVACRNDSTAPVQRVQISLYERLEWHTKPITTTDTATGQCRTTATLQQKHDICLTTINHVPHQGLKKEKAKPKGLLHSVAETVFGSGVTDAVTGRSGNGTVAEQLQRQIYHDLLVGNDTPIQLVIPPTTRPSFAGDLITISHVIKMEFHTGAFTCTPVLEIPIQVLAAPAPSTTGTSMTNQPARPSGAGDAYYIPPPGGTTPASAPLQKTPMLLLPPSETAEVTSMNGNGNGNDGSSHTNHERKNGYLVVHTTALPTKPLVAATTGIMDAVLDRNKTTPTTVGDGSSSSDTTTTTSSGAMTGEQRAAAIETSLQPPRSYIGRNKQDPQPQPRPFQVTSLANLVPLTAPGTTASRDNDSTVSVAELLRELQASMNEYEVIAEKLLEKEWVALVASLSPTDLASIVGVVHEFDQPRVAVVLASHLGHGGGITCEYIAAVLSVTSVHHRAVMTQKLLPLCTDAKQNNHLILAELNGWEQTVTEQALSTAMMR